MTTVKNLTFRSSNLGVNVSLMLCFTPPSNELFKSQFPVAWRVTTLAATGGATMRATWESDYAVCAAQIGGGSMVTAGNYSSIMPGQQTMLQVDKNQSPPTYYWTPPKSFGPGSVIRADNGTDAPAPIGVGFITGRGTINEDMSAAVIYPNVGVGLGVSAQFTPQLSAYLSLDYRQSQIVQSEVSMLTPLWTQNLLSLGPETTIWVSRNPDGSFSARQVSGSLGDDPVENTMSKSLDWYRGMTRVYRATLAFQSSSLVEGSLKRMTKKLLSKGYQVKIITKDDGTSANVELVLPIHTSCNDAENEMMGVAQTLQFPPPVAIQERGGEVLLLSAGSFSRWAPVNPASLEWYTKKSVGEGSEEAEAEVPQPKGQPLIANGGSGIANGNGTAWGSFADSNGDSDSVFTPNYGNSDSAALTPNYGNTRIVNRKASSASLATSYA